MAFGLALKIGFWPSGTNRECAGIERRKAEAREAKQSKAGLS
jgi:hypothetical protein